MTKCPHPIASPLVAALVFLAFHPPVSARAQSAPAAAPQTSATDVVILSLEAQAAPASDSQHVREGLLGNADAELHKEKQLLDIQMNIVRETAKFGPVLLVAPDEATQRAMTQRCAEFQICDLLRNDRVRIKIVPHDGLWVRDFGPQIEAAGDSAHVAHWRYFDIRKEEAKAARFQELETARLKLLEARQQEEQRDDFSEDASPDAHKAALSAIDAKILLLREYSQILSEASVQRSSDENSAFDIADAVLAAPDFTYQRSEVALDGGNLFKLEDGRCLTTRTLLSRNKNLDVALDRELEKVASCKSVTYLEPLPGPVIEHVDMFLLPAGGKRLLLASYDLSKPFAAEYWSTLTNDERDLALNAALAMDLNAERLRHLGYEVLQVPSPFPKIPANGHTYYPSILNALVRTIAPGSRQVILPFYKDYEPDIQASALHQIQDAFGSKTEIVTVESIEAAKSQGGIHCFTLNVPLRLSIFNDSADSARRTAYLAQKDQLDRSVAAKIASQIPATALRGSWAILENEEQSDTTPLDLYPQRIFFTEKEFQKGVFDRLESKGTYTVDSTISATWSLHLVFADQHAMPATVQWLNKDTLKLILNEGDTTLLLKRINSDQPSPFKPQPQDRQTQDQKKGPPTPPH
jgi:agmatine/peptidylarginine deiminase